MHEPGKLWSKKSLDPVNSKKKSWNKLKTKLEKLSWKKVFYIFHNISKYFYFFPKQTQTGTKTTNERINHQNVWGTEQKPVVRPVGCLGPGKEVGVSTRHGLYGLDPLLLAGRLSKKDNHQLCRCFWRQNDSSPALYRVWQKHRVRKCVTWRPISIWLSWHYVLVIWLP